MPGPHEHTLEDLYLLLGQALQTVPEIKRVLAQPDAQLRCVRQHQAHTRVQPHGDRPARCLCRVERAPPVVALVLVARCAALVSPSSADGWSFPSAISNSLSRASIARSAGALRRAPPA